MTTLQMIEKYLIRNDSGISNSEKAFVQACVRSIRLALVYRADKQTNKHHAYSICESQIEGASWMYSALLDTNYDEMIYVKYKALSLLGRILEWDISRKLYREFYTEAMRKL